MIFCVLLFFSLAGLESREGLGDSNQQAGLSKVEEHKIFSRKIGILNQDGYITTSVDDLRKLCDALNVETGEMEALVKEHQVFQLREGNGSYVPKINVTHDYVVIPGKTDRVKMIEETLETAKECPECSEEFTNRNDKGYVFVSGCNNKELHMLHYNCYLKLPCNQKLCPYCKKNMLDPKIETIFRDDLITKVFKTKNITYLENKIDKPSHWVLHTRNQKYDTEIKEKTGIVAEEWLLIGELVSESIMEVLEINLDNPKDLGEHYIDLLEFYEFSKVKFNNDQEERELFIVFEKDSTTKISYDGSFNVEEKQIVYEDGSIVDQRSEVCFCKKKQNIFHFFHDKRGKVDRYFFVFNKKNIEYFKQTKTLLIVGNRISKIYIGLEGDDIILKEDIDEIFITHNNEFGLVCDNLNNFSAMKTNTYGLLYPINKSKLAQIKDQIDTKFVIKETNLELIDEDCFLFPLFKFEDTKIRISFDITRQMMKKGCFPFKDLVKEFKNLVENVELVSEATDFKDYAVVFLFCFSENTLKARERITITLSEGIENRVLRIIKSLIYKPNKLKQDTQNLIFQGDMIDFAVETEILKIINFRCLILASLQKDIKEELIDKEDGLAIVGNRLKKLMLMNYAIKQLLFFKKGIHKISQLVIVTEDLENVDYDWFFNMIERIKISGIVFQLPSEDYFRVFGCFEKEIKLKFKEEKIIVIKNDMESY